MAILDFREIPTATGGTSNQDSFELFAKEVLSCLGFEILQGPSRGADGGKDLIIEEIRVGLIATTRLKWLVSCKHFAQAGSSVRPGDERNIIERVSAAGCVGFMGFYSTLPSSGLSDLLHRQSTVLTKIFDHEEIERYLLDSPRGRKIIERFFPKSLRKREHGPVMLVSGLESIVCDHCGKDLLKTGTGIWVLWNIILGKGETRSEHFVDLHFSCKGECDRAMGKKIRSRHIDLGFLYDGWDDLKDLTIPTVYLRKQIAVMNGLANGNTYETAVFEKFKQLFIECFPYVTRELSDSEEHDLERLKSIPSYLGGMGFDQ